MAEVVYLGLGGNLNEPPKQFENALHSLNNRQDTQVLAISPLYISAPVGPPQPDYVNACASISTDLSPDELQLVLKRLEAEQGRQPGGDRWGPRPLDIDILLYGDGIVNTDELTIPHRELYNREFVLQPLYDLAPDLRLPDGQRVADLLRGVASSNLRAHPQRIEL